MKRPIPIDPLPRLPLPSHPHHRRHALPNRHVSPTIRPPLRRRQLHHHRPIHPRRFIPLQRLPRPSLLRPPHASRPPRAPRHPHAPFRTRSELARRLARSRPGRKTLQRPAHRLRLLRSLPAHAHEFLPRHVRIPDARAHPRRPSAHSPPKRSAAFTPPNPRRNPSRTRDGLPPDGLLRSHRCRRLRTVFAPFQIHNPTPRLILRNPRRRDAPPGPLARRHARQLPLPGHAQLCRPAPHASFLFAPDYPFQNPHAARQDSLHLGSRPRTLRRLRMGRPSAFPPPDLFSFARAILADHIPKRLAHPHRFPLALRQHRLRPLPRHPLGLRLFPPLHDPRRPRDVVVPARSPASLQMALARDRHHLRHHCGTDDR